MLGNRPKRPNLGTRPVQAVGTTVQVLASLPSPPAAEAAAATTITVPQPPRG